MTTQVHSVRKTTLILLALLLGSMVARATVRRVNPASPGIGGYTGADWTLTAYNNLQTAINASAAGDSVWVKEGTYMPASGESFSMKAGVKILGGFIGVETAISQRFLVLGFNSILQGNGSRVVHNNNNGLDTSAVLDGFIIKGGNASGSFGGGMENYFSAPMIRNCVFTENLANYGHAIEVYQSGTYLVNCVFYNNGDGYGIATIYIYGNAHISNCTIVSNSCNTETIIAQTNAPYVTNCIFWNNHAYEEDILNPQGRATYSIGRGLGAGPGNLGLVDPVFVNSASPIGPDGKWFTADDGLRLRPLSPAIDAGTVLAEAPADINGIARPQAGAYDLGAYEGVVCPSITRLYVDGAAAAGGNGSSWATAVNSLSTALTIARNCSNVTEIWVKKGTYMPSAMPYTTSSADSRDRSFYLLNNVSIYGGFTGTETTLAQRNPGANPTILSGDIGAAGNASDNCYHTLVSSGNDNTAKLDGFIINGGNANGSTSVTINGLNMSQGAGGGLATYSASPLISNCVFTGNNANDGGGIYLYYSSSSPAFTNCAMVNNTASGSGGGMFIGFSTTPFIVNCTIAGNTATAGGGLFSYLIATPNLSNCIIWGNNSGIASTVSTPVISYSIVQGGYTGTGNSGSDPLFYNSADPDGTDNKWMTMDDGLRVQAGSPALDNGTATGAPATDIRGAARPLGSGYDMGAYEGPLCFPDNHVYVSATAAAGGDGLSWATAFNSLSDAITAAGTCPNVTAVWVKAGTYQPAAGQSFSMVNNLAIIGGFAGTETTLAQRNLALGYNSILQGNGGRVIHNNDNGLNNSAVLDGFVITGGNTNVTGGGIFNYYASPIIRNCVFTGNTATSAQGGGGASNHGGTPDFINCIFSNNTAQWGAGFRTYGQARLINCTFAGNASNSGGAAIANEIEGAIVTNTIIWSNNTNSLTSPAGIDGNGTPAVTYSMGQNVGSGTGNRDSISPLFVNVTNPAGPDGKWFTADDGLRLSACSPAANTGTATSAPATDISGYTRPYGGTIDMGAYELQAATGGTTLTTGNDTTAVIISMAGINILTSSSCTELLHLRSRGSSPLRDLVYARVYKESGVLTYMGQPYVQRHYDISPVNNPNSATARVTLFFTQAEFNAYNTATGAGPYLPTGSSDAAGKANLLITQYHGTSATGQPGTYSGSTVAINPADADIVWNATASRWEVSFNVTGFSGFFVTAGTTPLPLNLLHFSGKTTKGGNMLEWATANEKNTRHFDIEKSADGKSWAYLSTTTAAGQGDHSYTAYDAQPLEGANYYRLKMTDKDGDFNYSPVVLLHNNRNGIPALQLYPNPATREVHITMSGAENAGTLVLYTVTGRKVKEQSLTQQSTTMSLEGLPAGIYSIQLVTAQAVLTQKLVIEE